MFCVQEHGQFLVFLWALCIGILNYTKLHLNNVLSWSFQNCYLLFSKPSVYGLAVCCRLSLHWKINLQPKWRSLTNPNSFSPSIYLCLALSMLVFIPTRFFQKQPQGMMLPLPFLMLGWFVPNIFLCFRWIDLGLIRPQNSSRRFGVA